MWERLFIGSIVLLVYIGASYVVYQSKKVVIHHRQTKSIWFIKTVGILTFLGIPIYVNGTLSFYDIFLLLPILLIFGIFPYNLGLTENGIYKYRKSHRLSRLLSNFIPFRQTKEWVVFEEKKRLKVRTTVVHDVHYEEVTYLYFDKEKKEEIISHIEANAQDIKVM
jgi:Ca2+/Na+ antiporter